MIFAGSGASHADMLDKKFLSKQEHDKLAASFDFDNCNVDEKRLRSSRITANSMVHCGGTLRR